MFCNNAIQIIILILQKSFNVIKNNEIDKKCVFNKQKKLKLAFFMFIFCFY